MADSENTKTNPYDYSKTASQHTAENTRKSYYAEKYNNPDYFTIPESYYATPEMGDFYLGAVDTTYLAMFDKNLKNLKEGQKGDAKSAAFYTEAPPLLNNKNACQNGVYFVSAPVSTDFSEESWQTPTKLRVKIGDLSCSNQKTLTKLKTEIANRKNPYEALTDQDYITIQLYGMDYPDPNRIVTESNIDEKYFKIEKSPAEIKDEENDTNEFFLPSNYLNTSLIGTAGYTDEGLEYILKERISIGGNKYSSCAYFLKLNQNYYGIFSYDDSVAKENQKLQWLAGTHQFKNIDTDEKNKTICINLIKDLIEKSDDQKIYFQIDTKADTSNIPSYFDDISSSQLSRDTLKIWAGNNLHGILNGYCLAKEEYSGQFNGSAYIKINGKWVNIVKAMIASMEEYTVSAKDEAHHNSNADNLEVKVNNNFASSDESLFPATYDKDKLFYADAFFATLEELDDRKKIQKEIFGQEWDELKKWTVTIGDVTMFIPPTAISVTTETTEERMPLLRASGSMAKSGKRTTKSLTMELYFYGDKGINGYEYKNRMPNETETTYYMNGFRALVSEFKFTPFLPIENEYINETLGIYAVVFDNFTFSNVNSIGPKLIHATLTLSEFDYGVYMPELYLLCSEYGYQGNPFAASINWSTMRYYYQRAIARGEEMSALECDMNSKEYLLKALANRTALQHAKFNNSEIKFFTPNIEYLEKMLECRRNIAKNRQGVATMTDTDSELLKRIGNVAALINSTINGNTFQQQLDKFFNKLDNKLVFLRLNNTTPLIYCYADKKSTLFNKDAISLLQVIERNVKNHAYLKGAKYFTEAEIPTKNSSVDYIAVKFSLGFRFKNDGYFTSDNINHLRQVMASELNVSEKKLLQDDMLHIDIVLKFDKTLKKETGSTYSLVDCVFEEEYPDHLLRKYALSYAKKQSLEDGSDNSAEGWQKNPLYYQLDNMKFDYLDVDNFEVTDFTVQMKNRVSRLNVCDVNGSSPQYLGGEDTVLNIVIKTTDPSTVNAFVNLPVYSAITMRKYREVIPCFPLKIDSGFTRLLGIGEVNISHVQADTVPNQPGVYIIILSLVSVDRTLRNREALQMIEAQNEGSISDASEVAERTLQSYFD